MASQLDLIGRIPVKLKPESGRTEPRLWVRRLVVWSDPKTVLREVRLRPGLNIVWSPDPADRDRPGEGDGGLGHGSGKTLFCRLVRYCLGEERFAPDRQRDRIAHAFKDGLVGAEVVVDGTAWAVVRSIGMTRKHLAVQGGDLEALAVSNSSSTGMGPLLDAVENVVITNPVAELISADGPPQAWLAALAWLTRDQECRFDHVLDWRAAASDSGSPVRSWSDAERLEALRALLNALTPEEQAIRRRVSSLESERAAGERDLGHRKWSVAQLRRRLSADLAVPAETLPGVTLAGDVLKRAAVARLASTAVLTSTAGPMDADQARAAYEASRRRAVTLEGTLARLDGLIPELEKVVQMIRGEIPGVSFREHGAEHPACPVCEVPVDRALAEGCKLSHKLPDLAEIRQRRDQLIRELKAESERLQAALEERNRGQNEHAEAQAELERAHTGMLAAEQARESGREEWFAVRRSLEDAGRSAEWAQPVEEAEAQLLRLGKEVDGVREHAAELRGQQARVFRHASKLFDTIIGELVGPEATGRITLDGNGLHLGVEMGGDRSTAAIDSLKVLAFDLTALCMSIEGRTSVPAFLLHDSPREADLGLSRYHRVIRFARALESVGPQPLFQYILTTTTRPPKELSREPWLALTLEGTPAAKRLLGRDL